MDHVKGRQVGELLTAQEEEGVDEVDELGEEVPPGHVGGIEPVLSVGVVDRLTEPAVLPWQVTDIQSHCQLVLSTFQSHFHLDQFLGQFGENGEVLKQIFISEYHQHRLGFQGIHYSTTYS